MLIERKDFLISSEHCSGSHKSGLASITRGAALKRQMAAPVFKTRWKSRERLATSVSEPVETSGDWSARAATLSAHGASMKEISFLRHRRVELNAMPADVFIRFLVHKLAEHGIGKVVPDNDVLE
jgi:hypothetical protein